MSDPVSQALDSFEDTFRAMAPATRAALVSHLRSFPVGVVQSITEIWQIDDLASCLARLDKELRRGG